MISWATYPTGKLMEWCVLNHKYGSTDLESQGRLNSKVVQEKTFVRPVGDVSFDNIC